jgi:hypothetical protein
LSPLIGSTGMIKKIVMNRMPRFFMKAPTVPQFPHFI